MNKRILLLLSVFFLAHSVVNAQTWIEKAASTFGADSTDAGIIINSAETFGLLAKCVNEGTLLNDKIMLGADIDLENLVWVPIGTSDRPFTLNFDGGGKNIKGLNVKGDQSNAGLFGVVGSTDATPAPEIKNVSLLTGSVAGKKNVGSLIGLLVKGTVSGCFNNAVVVIGAENTGGLIGAMNAGSLSISANTGAVSGNKTVGGLVGLSSSAAISQSYNVGSVLGREEATGGIVGVLEAGGTLHDVYNVAEVSGISMTGGIVGSIDKASCENTYNLGVVTGKANYMGSLIGRNNTGVFTNNLYDNVSLSLEAVGSSTTAKDIENAKGATPAELIDAFTSSPWVAEEGMYPRLAGLDETDVAVVNALSVSLVVNPDSVIADFELPVLGGVTWSSSSDSLQIENGSVTVKRSTEANIPVVLTARKGAASRTFNLVIAQRIVFLVTLSVRESEAADITISAVTEAQAVGVNTYQIDKGDDFKFKVTWPAQYESLDVLVDSKPVELLADSTFIISNIQKAQTVLVKGYLKRFRVLAEATTGGTVSVSPVIVNDSVPYGTKLTLKAIPDEFYQLDRWDPTEEISRTVTVVVKSDTTYRAIFIATPTSKVTLSSDSKGVSFSISNYPSEETIQELEKFSENDNGYEIIERASLIRFKVGVLAEYNRADMKVTLINGATSKLLESDPNGVYEVKDVVDNITISVTGVVLGGFKLTLPAEADITGGRIALDPYKASYNFGDKVKVSAIADEDYRFDKWSNGRADSVYTITISSNMKLPIPLFISTLPPVSNEQIGASSFKIYTREGMICIEQPTNEKVDIYVVGLAGNAVCRKRSSDTFVQIPVTQKGIYVVSVNKYVQKVIIR